MSTGPYLCLSTTSSHNFTIPIPTRRYLSIRVCGLAKREARKNRSRGLVMVRRRSRFIGVYRPVRSFPGSSLLIVNQRLVIHWLIVEGTSSRASVLLRANGDIEKRAGGVNCSLPSIIINSVVRWTFLTRRNADGSRRPTEVE